MASDAPPKTTNVVHAKLPNEGYGCAAVILAIGLSIALYKWVDMGCPGLK